ncbi:hypothetical protein Tco_1424759, partial [Tanacetum coccineum]
MTGILPTLPTLVSNLTFISSIFSFGSKDTIFDPGIVTFLEPVAFSMAVSCSKIDPAISEASRVRCFIPNNGGDDGDGNENRNVNGRGDRPVSRECTYQDFMKCQPLSFKGTEGVVGLIRWSEKMETMFHISNCPERYQVKYATAHGRRAKKGRALKDHHWLIANKPELLKKLSEHFMPCLARLT